MSDERPLSEMLRRYADRRETLDTPDVPYLQRLREVEEDHDE